MQIFFKSLIQFYKIFLSPLLGGQCRFYPSCSDYAFESLDHLPLRTALVKIGRRLLSCHPFHEGYSL